MRPTASHFQCRSEVYVFVCMRRMKHMLRPYTVVTTSERAVCVCAYALFDFRRVGEGVCACFISCCVCGESVHVLLLRAMHLSVYVDDKRGCFLMYR